MPLCYAIGGMLNTPPGAIKGNGAPSASFRGDLGQQYFDFSTTPPTEYVFNGQTWTIGGASPATTTTFGTVELSTLAQLQGGTAAAGAVVPLANDVFTFVNGIVLAGAAIAQTAVTGITNLATDAQAVAGTATVPGVTALAVQPSNLAAVFAAPPATGGTTPAAAVFTTLGATTVTFTA